MNIRLIVTRRKQPKQARSRQMRAAISSAAIRVLAREEPLRFTTARVADVAGRAKPQLAVPQCGSRTVVLALSSQSVLARKRGALEVASGDALGGRIRPEWPIASRNQGA
jgi:hypothetical protein